MEVPLLEAVQSISVDAIIGHGMVIGPVKGGTILSDAKVGGTILVQLVNLK